MPQTVFILLISLALISFSNCEPLSNSSLNENNLKTFLRPEVERVFSRKKRWMLFPKGSHLKFTMSVSKRLLAMYPKGFNFVLEAAVYYPMPSTRIDLIPKRFRQPTPPKPKPKQTTPIYLVGIPGSLIKYRAKPATTAPKIQRIDQNESYMPWLGPSNTTFNHLQKWSKYSSPEYWKNYQWSGEKQQKYVNKYQQHNHNKKWYSSIPSKLYPSQYTNKWNRQPRSIDDFDGDYEPLYFEELSAFEDSPHYHTYRGRRELFHHFEGLSNVLGIDMKSCILRAICDSKRFLLPPGYSMIQDILRVIFTFPKINGLKDDYTRVMEFDYQTCDAYIHNKCPFSILDWLLNSKKNFI